MEYTAGQIVKFDPHLSDASDDESARFIVIEDRGNRLLVKTVERTLKGAIEPTFCYPKTMMKLADC